MEAFVAFLDALPREIGTLAILGDLFAAWIGRRELERPHHALVIAALRRLRGRGCRLLYVEGNHDFFLAPLYENDPFDRIARESLDLPLAGSRTHMAHGDLVNRQDRPYRAWRALTKNRLFFGAFNLAPRGARARIVDSIERRLAGTNARHRARFPLEECEVYARRRIREGAEILVFGHFHEERRLEFTEGGRRGTVYVLPAWFEGRRYLKLDPATEPAFVSA